MTHTPRGFPANPLIPSEGTPPPPPAAQSPEEYVPGELTKKFLSSLPEVPPSTTDSPPDLAEDFRHGGWAPFRRRVAQALSATPGITPRRLAAFRTCGCDAFVHGRTIHPALPSIMEYKIRATKCHDRFCVPCSQERSNRIRQSLLTHMAPLEGLKLITLTLAASDKPLSAILDRITRCFRLLRNKAIWKKNVQGGVAIIETKLGKNSGTWHVHFHVVAAAKYIPQAKISEEWLAITGDSRIVDIRPVGAKTGAVSYITKYITKAADHSIVTSESHLSEAIVAFTGRRLVTTFGTWRGLQLMERPADDSDTYWDENCKQRLPRGEWRGVGSLSTILQAAASGDAAAIRVVQRLRRPAGRPPPDLRQLPPVQT